MRRWIRLRLERLKDYLAQLPPKSQALLMREFERAIERGEDTVVANIVLEELRKIVRALATMTTAPHRGSGPAFVPPAEPFLIEGTRRCARDRSGAAR